MSSVSRTPDFERSKLLLASSVHTRSRSQRPKPPFVYWENSLSPPPRVRRPLRRVKNERTQEHYMDPNQDFRLPSDSKDKAKYTVKYIGVTNGQIGILSTKRPIPKLSYVDACPSTPLPMIYASVSRKLLPAGENYDNFLKDELSFIETHAKDRIRLKHIESPGSWAEQEYAVHRYSIPRGLVAVRRQKPEDSIDKSAEWGRGSSPEYKDFALRYELEKQKRFPTPRMRRGMSGWMLSGYRLEEQPVLHSIVKRKSQDKPKADGNSEITGDLYLKYLKLKYSLQKAESEKSRSVSQT